MKTVLLIRHGETAVPKGMFCGRTDVALSALGERQSQEIVHQLAIRDIQLVITTGLRRTDWCGNLAASYTIAHMLDSDLREVDFGAWEGMTWAGIEKSSPGKAETWLNYPEKMQFPNGEAMADFHHRLQSAWQRIMAFPAERLAVVGHSAALSYILQYIGERKTPLYLQHGEIIELRIRVPRLEPKPRTKNIRPQ